MNVHAQHPIRAAALAMLWVALLIPPSQAAMNRGRPINWGGGIGRDARANGPHFSQWRPLWRFVWSATRRNYDMRPAPSVAGSPNCPADLGIGPIVERIIGTTYSHRYGDAVHALGQFQRRLLCLDPDGAHGVDFALSAFNALAVRDLHGRERDEAVIGSFNAGLLAFDTVQYSGRSWWLPVMYHDYNTERSLIRRFPGTALGLWLYDVRDGRLHQLTFGRANPAVYRGLMRAFAHPGVFGQGDCSLLGMAGTGFVCGGGGGDNRWMGGGGGGAGGGGGSGMGGGSGAGLSCMVSAAMNTGSLGTLSCMVRAGGLGGTRIPVTATSHLQIQGVFDTQCAQNDGSGKAPRLPDYDKTKAGSEHADAKESHWYDAVLNFIHDLNFVNGGSGGGGSSSSSGSQSKPPPEPQPGQVGYGQMKAARDAYFDRQRAKLNKHGLKKFKNKGGHAVNGGVAGGGSGCGGNGTNAAARVAALFACTGTGSARGGMSASGPRFPGAGGGGPLSMPGPAAGGVGAPSGLLSCAMQGGRLVRAGVHDRRCQQTDCAPGASCSCNGSGGPGQAAAIGAAGRRAVSSPNNANWGAIDFGRNHYGNGGGFTGPKIPGHGGGPSKR